MTGDEHYRESEKLSDAARAVIKDADAQRAEVLADNDPESVRGRVAVTAWLDAHGAARNLIELANVHATLALAAATHKVGVYAHGMDDSGYGRLAIGLGGAR